VIFWPFLVPTWVSFWNHRKEVLWDLGCESWYNTKKTLESLGYPVVRTVWWSLAESIPACDERMDRQTYPVSMSLPGIAECNINDCCCVHSSSAPMHREPVKALKVWTRILLTIWLQWICMTVVLWWKQKDCHIDKKYFTSFIYFMTLFLCHLFVYQ